jgi:hypothetical protein
MGETERPHDEASHESNDQVVADGDIGETERHHRDIDNGLTFNLDLDEGEEEDCLTNSYNSEAICCCGCKKRLSIAKDHTHKCHMYVSLSILLYSLLTVLRTQV